MEEGWNYRSSSSVRWNGEKLASGSRNRKRQQSIVRLSSGFWGRPLPEAVSSLMPCRLSRAQLKELGIEVNNCWGSVDTSPVTPVATGCVDSYQRHSQQSLTTSPMWPQKQSTSSWPNK